MLLEIEFEKIPGFSRLFCDFLKRAPFFIERLADEQNLFENHQIIEKKLKSYTKRKQFLQLLAESNSDIELTEQQKENLKVISKENSVVVMTGQQPAVFGGPLYTLYKSLSAIQLCNKLKEHYPDYDFVPVFWLEDNDHDIQEATQVYLLDNLGNPLAPDVSQSSNPNKKQSISNLPIDNNLISFLEFYLESNNFTLSQPLLVSQILNFYKNEKYLVVPFKKIINLVTGKFGLLFLSSSLCRKNYAFVEIIQKELEYAGTSNKIIETTNQLIESKGYHIQAKSSVVNIFFHLDGERIKVNLDTETNKYRIKNEIYSAQELLTLFKNFPTNFSPNVLLRPICQDFIVPTIASILGPSEIGYTTQLPELYNWFSVVMPAIVPRHSLTFVPAEFSKNLAGYEFEILFQSRESLEKMIYFQNRDIELLQQIENLEIRFKSIFKEMQEIASCIDRTLVASSDAHFSKSFRFFQALKEKIFSNERRKILEKFRSVLYLNRLIFPKGTLQERFFATIYPLLIFGTEKFSNTIEPIFTKPRNKHYLIVI